MIRVEQFGIQLNEKQLSQFQKYYEMLTEWNKVMNLTAITEYSEVVVKHFLDSLAIGKKITFSDGDRLIDVGTGAGFPGIPLKIAFPFLQVTLLDSLDKRLKFLQAVIDEIGLNDIETVHGRAEDFGRNPLYREKYDYCVSRAVANLSSLSEFCLPFVKVGGQFISYKGDKAEEECKNAKSAIFLLGGKLQECFHYDLEDNTRNLVIIQKTTPTAKQYPRKAGTPLKKPL